MLATEEITEHLWSSLAEAFETTVMRPVERVQQEEDFEYNGLLLAGSITFTGDMKGCISLLSSFGCAKNLTRGMLMMEPDEELDESEVKDAVGEIVNLLVGGVKSRLFEESGQISISIPTVTTGRNMRPSLGLGTQRLSVFARTGNHLFEVVCACKQ